MTWISFETEWESRTARRVRRGLSKQNWGVQMDVVFVGAFKSEGHYGDMDMYPFSIQVYQVEAARPSGIFDSCPAHQPSCALSPGRTPIAPRIV